MLHGCLKQRFIPDPYDPELSRFTSKELQTGTCYINDLAYINYWPESGISISGLPYPEITKLINPNGPDSLVFSWEILRSKEGKAIDEQSRWISFKIPVVKGFKSNDLLSWNEKRFTPGECAVYLDWEKLAGTAGIYFVKTSERSTNQAAAGSIKYFYMTGLFNGNIGDSIMIKKGRFDFIVQAGGF